MTAPKGNKFWEARSKHGNDPIFDDAAVLWGACCEYFQWVEDNPLWEAKVAQYQGVPVKMTMPKMRAMTVIGLCMFLDISKSTWENYRKREGFLSVTTRADDVIRKQKLEGAAADLLNANIIARDLGMVDKSERTNNTNVTFNMGFTGKDQGK